MYDLLPPLQNAEEKNLVLLAAVVVSIKTAVENQVDC